MYTRGHAIRVHQRPLCPYKTYTAATSPLQPASLLHALLQLRLASSDPGVISWQDTVQRHGTKTLHEDMICPHIMHSFRGILFMSCQVLDLKLFLSVGLQEHPHVLDLAVPRNLRSFQRACMSKRKMKGAPRYEDIAQYEDNMKTLRTCKPPAGALWYELCCRHVGIGIGGGE